MSQASCASHQLSCPPWGHSAGSQHRSVLRRPSHHSILLWSPLHPTWLRRGSWKQLKSVTPSRNRGLAEHKGAVTKWSVWGHLHLYQQPDQPWLSGRQHSTEGPADQIHKSPCTVVTGAFCHQGLHGMKANTLKFNIQEWNFNNQEPEPEQKEAAEPDRVHITGTVSAMAREVWGVTGHASLLFLRSPVKGVLVSGGRKFAPLFPYRTTRIHLNMKATCFYGHFYCTTSIFLQDSVVTRPLYWHFPQIIY